MHTSSNLWFLNFTISPHLRHANSVPTQVRNVESGFVFRDLQLGLCK